MPVVAIYSSLKDSMSVVILLCRCKIHGRTQGGGGSMGSKDPPSQNEVTSFNYLLITPLEFTLRGQHPPSPRSLNQLHEPTVDSTPRSLNRPEADSTHPPPPPPARCIDPRDVRSPCIKFRPPPPPPPPLSRRLRTPMKSKSHLKTNAALSC